MVCHYRDALRSLYSDEVLASAGARRGHCPGQAGHGAAPTTRGWAGTRPTRGSPPSRRRPGSGSLRWSAGGEQAAGRAARANDPERLRSVGVGPLAKIIRPVLESPRSSVLGPVDTAPYYALKVEASALAPWPGRGDVTTGRMGARGGPPGQVLEASGRSCQESGAGQGSRRLASHCACVLLGGVFATGGQGGREARAPLVQEVDEGQSPIVRPPATAAARMNIRMWALGMPSNSLEGERGTIVSRFDTSIVAEAERSPIEVGGMDASSGGPEAGVSERGGVLGGCHDGYGARSAMDHCVADGTEQHPLEGTTATRSHDHHACVVGSRHQRLLGGTVLDSYGDRQARVSSTRLLGGRGRYLLRGLPERVFVDVLDRRAATSDPRLPGARV